MWLLNGRFQAGSTVLGSCEFFYSPSNSVMSEKQLEIACKDTRCRADMAGQTFQPSDSEKKSLLLTNELQILSVTSAVPCHMNSDAALDYGCPCGSHIWESKGYF